ncbi:MAG: hypothetical protein QXZ31_08395 [Thermofilaceae archaeon]
MAVRVVGVEELPRMVIARANYSLLAKAMSSGKAIIVQGSAQRVSKMRRRLAEILGEPVAAVIAYIDGEKVYILIRERDLLGEGLGGVEGGDPEGG